MPTDNTPQERREEIARIVSAAISEVLNTEYNPSFNLNIAGAKVRRAMRDEAPRRAAETIMALSAPPLAEEAVKKALGLAMAALQTIQGMEPITHEITLPTVMAQHATDALNDIRALHNGFCTNPCGEGSCAGELRIALVCDRCGWEDQ